VVGGGGSKGDLCFRLAEQNTNGEMVVTEGRSDEGAEDVSWERYALDRLTLTAIGA